MKTKTSLHPGSALKPINLPSLAAVAILIAGASSGHAQSGTWNLSGAGNWSGTANWQGGTVADGSGSTATFTSGGATTVHLDGSRTIGNLTFSTAGTYLIDNNGSASNILTLAGTTPTINVAGSTTVTISSQIAGTAGLTKFNGGASSSVLILTGSNTYSGTTTLSGGNVGFLQINANAALGASDLFINSANGGLRYGAAFNDLRNIAFGSSGGRIDTNGFDVTISSAFSGSIGVGGSFTKQGTGTLTLAGANNLTGPGGVSVTGGALQIDSDARLGSGTGTLLLNGGAIRYGASFNDLRSITLGTNDGTIDTNGFNAVYSGTITGIAGQDLTKAGSGTLTISSNQSYAGATNVNAGTLLINGTTGSGNVTVASLATLGGNGTIGGTVSVSGNGTLAPGTLSDPTSTLTLASSNLTMSNVNSRMALDITGTAAGDFDRIVGINLLTLNGDITITLTGSYTSASWDLLDFASRSASNFDSITLAGSYNGTLTRSGDIWSNANIGGQAWEFDQTTGVLTAVPEPSVAALLVGATVLGFASRRRRS
jgi:autotransporter-associated beta strand protein